MLSTRILFFSSFQPYWVCKAGSRGGGVPSSDRWIAALDLEFLLSPLEAQAAAHTSGAGVQKAPEYLGYLWPATAEQYSSRKFSVLDDKLLAIHAVKERYREGNGSCYVAGAWLDKLHIDLLWSAEEPHERSAEERARFGPGYDKSGITDLPSWSWLSYDGRIENFAQRELSGQVPEGFVGTYRAIRRIRVARKPTTDSFGRIAGKQPLRLRCPVKKVLAVPQKVSNGEGRRRHGHCYKPDVWDGAAHKYRSDVEQLPVHLENVVGAALFDDFVRLPEDKTFSHYTEVVSGVNTSRAVNMAPLHLECALVMTSEISHKDPEKRVDIAFGVLLGDVEGSNGTQKRRIGCFKGERNMAAYFGDAREMEFDFL
ncbi:hypothetical protein RB595_007341 [Gaeumannomyces hyphopodioides]